MRGSRLAYEIESDLKREEYFKKKVKRKECIVNNNRNCKECNYRYVCDNNLERSDSFEIL